MEKNAILPPWLKKYASDDAHFDGSGLLLLFNVDADVRFSDGSADGDGASPALVVARVPPDCLRRDVDMINSGGS